MNRTVHPKQNAGRTRDPFQRGRALLNELLGDLKLPVAFASGTFLPVRTLAAVVAFIVRDLTFIAALRLFHADVFRPDLLPRLACILVMLSVICHVFPQSHVALILLCLAPFVILRLDVAFRVYILEI